MPIHYGGSEGSGFLRPGPPAARIPLPGIIRAHSPAGSFIGTGGPAGQQHPVILVIPNSVDDEDEDYGDDNDVQIRWVGGQPRPRPHSAPERIPVQTENGVVFLRRVGDYDSERSSSPDRLHKRGFGQAFLAGGWLRSMSMMIMLPRGQPRAIAVDPRQGVMPRTVKGGRQWGR